MGAPLRDLAALLAAQCNAVGRWQMSRSQRRAAVRAVRNGDWQAPTNQVFVQGRAPLSVEAQMWVAVLHGGPHARLTGSTALTLHGWTQPVQQPLHVAVPAAVHRSKTPAWIRLHRLVSVDGPAARPARVNVHEAVIQAVNCSRTDRQAMFILLSCLQQRLVSPRAVLRHMRRCPRRELITTIVDEFLHGITSINEHDFARLCRTWDLPEPVGQRRVYDASGKLRAIDAEFRLPDGRIRRVEIEGLHHFEPANFLRDIDRHNDLIIKGDVYLRVVSFTIKYEPDRFRAVLTAWLECKQSPHEPALHDDLRRMDNDVVHSAQLSTAHPNCPIPRNTAETTG